MTGTLWAAGFAFDEIEWMKVNEMSALHDPDWIEKSIQQITSATQVERGQVIQSLWSGYGEIVRLTLTGSSLSSAVLKHVNPPQAVNHPRGWHSDLSHRRKLKSYQVEMHWYQHWNQKCGSGCRVPKCYTAQAQNEECYILLEDLDAAGFALRKSAVNKRDIHQCLDWLASFHGTFLGEAPDGLWETGTYWHLETRPDEWAVMKHEALKSNAGRIDQMLNQGRFQTFVHGDAKLANFCFADDEQSVAAVDFQYVGGGCGMKDVAYFLGSCLDEAQCEVLEEELLTYYFSALHKTLRQQNKDVDFKALEKEWRRLFPVAWTDFYRFLVGWMPDHWKINPYTQRLANHVLNVPTAQ